MKKVLILTIVLAALLSLAPVTSAGGCCGCCVAPRSPGYWMNHPEAWPQAWIDWGGVVVVGDESFTKEQAIALMKAPVKGDKTLTMFPALVAAWLNYYNGACICDAAVHAIQEGDWWFELPGIDVGSGVKASSEEWQYSHGEAIYWALDAYNNGYLCH